MVLVHATTIVMVMKVNAREKDFALAEVDASTDNVVCAKGWPIGGPIVASIVLVSVVCVIAHAVGLPPGVEVVATHVLCAHDRPHPGNRPCGKRPSLRPMQILPRSPASLTVTSK